jgi:hypothetical protein
MKHDAIGGYFELEVSAYRGERYPEAMRYQSARAAFVALLRACKPAAVWMPWFICDSMIEPLLMTGTPVRRYSLDDRLRVQDAEVARGEWLFYVNYFGMCDGNIEALLQRFPRDQVVIDQSQAFYGKPQDCVATLYSPRKFFGVPDGGYLLTKHDVATPERVDEGSVARCMPMLQRLAFGPERGYGEYVAGEASLSMQEPMQMSALTQRLLGGIDYDRAAEQRRSNFALLHERLGHDNEFDLAREALDQPSAVPLCYPFRGAGNGVREALFRERIYTPAYWPEVAANDNAPATERSLAGSTLCLPCDQRLSIDQLERMTQCVMSRT